jgi:hypothetical protein
MVELVTPEEMAALLEGLREGEAGMASADGSSCRPTSPFCPEGPGYPRRSRFPEPATPLRLGTDLPLPYG